MLIKTVDKFMYIHKYIKLITNIYFCFCFLFISVVISEVGKRKKLKSRNTAAAALSATLIPPAATRGSNNSGYSKDHLDAWLETCLKDASATQLSSSSEFLDYNPASSTAAPTASSSAAAAITAMTTNNLNYKNSFSMPSSMAQHQQQQSLYAAANINQHQQSQQQQQHLQQFAMKTNPMNNGTGNNIPNNSNSFNTNLPFSQGFQRVSWALKFNRVSGF